MDQIGSTVPFLAAALPSFVSSSPGSQPTAQLPLSATAKAPASPFTPELEAFARAVMDEWKAPGLSIAVIDGEETFSKGFGFATLPDVPAKPETLWLGASTAKAFVGATLAHFIQNETYKDELRKGWATPISSILPDDFVLMDEWATKHLTLEDAISHRTGMPRHDLSWTYSENGSHVPTSQITKSLRHLPLSTEPRVIIQYCNLMYMVLSDAIEKLTKKPLKTTFHELIWGPLGMDSTYLDAQDAKKSTSPHATGYYWDEANQRYGEILDDTLQESGAAGIISNVLDLAKWVRCLIDKTEPLSEKTHDDIRNPRVVTSGEPANGYDILTYSLGWQRTTFHGEPMYKHAGQSITFGANIYWLPERKFGVVAMGSVYKRSNAAQDIIIRRLIEDAMGIDEKDRFDYAKKVKETFDKDTKEFLEAEEKLFPDTPKERLPSSFSMEQLVGEYSDPGYGAMTFKDVSDGKRSVLEATMLDKVFQFNVRLEHVSGDNWVARYVSTIHSRLPMYAFEAKFKTGDAGPVLDISYTDDTAGVDKWTVSFYRVA